MSKDPNLPKKVILKQSEPKKTGGELYGLEISLLQELGLDDIIPADKR